ncbi:MAG: sigma 54-interacting transcriptional regulator [Bacteroidota bacterium]
MKQYSSEQLLRFARFTIEQISDKVYWLDESGHFFFVNEAVCKTMGYTRAELSNMSIFDLNLSMTPQKWKTHWAQNRKDQSLVETVHRHKSGDLIPVEIINNFIDFDGQTYSCSIVRDITERKKKEAEFQKIYEQLLDSEQSARLSHFTVQKASDAIFWMCKQGNIKHVNQAACDRMGYTYDELVQLNILDLNQSFDLEQLHAFWATMEKTGNHIAESVHTTRAGKAIPVEINANFIEFEGERYTCSIVRDITERKRKEAALRGALMEIRELKERLEAENNYLQEEISTNNSFGEIISQSEDFHEVLKQVEQVADTSSTVLITGESGTGKELIARALHQLSNRADRPMIKVNCATLPSNLIESELFGHEKGAFTGAFQKKVGRFELADRGTLFLDEIGEMPIELQAKLLRALQEGEFERLGGTQTIKVDVRIVAATNRDLEKEVEKGQFREDLFYRLNVFPIHCLPLRRRKEDIPLLVRHFCKKFESRIGKIIHNIPQKVIQQLQSYDFPGNIRELENIVERAVIVSKNGKLQLGNWLPKNKVKVKNDELLTLDEMQKKHIIEVLKVTKWRISGEKGAAKILGMKPTTLESRMKKLEIQRSMETQ